MRTAILSILLCGFPGPVLDRTLAVELGDPVELPRIENPLHGALPPDAWANNPVVIIEFCALWSGQSRTRIPRLNALRERFAGQGLLVLGFTVEPEASFRSALKDLVVAPNYPVFRRSS